MREVGAIDNITYRQLNGCSARQASSDLKKLQALDLISSKGNNRSTYYVPSQRLLELKHTTFEANSVFLDANSVCSDANGVCSDANDVCIEAIYSQLPEDLNKQIESLGQRCKTGLLESIVVQLCEITPLDVEQLATLTNRSIIHLRNRVIPKLMREKRLFFTIPEMVKHPNQKYTTKKG